ncbi:Asp-tRNA(Asn)/Glu-tRNA(Gln) amidotransferase subunit GatA [Fervidobacterium thailandense]|uniref:Glutamyl-tRNA(Gln) amidotransferase subunit A n=1 Tax=Fervidobacterium thailandense TaxID=1008305 RepID=A0A1E3G5E2_9BACT|nr:Asp-tRNA(Asn)/Glu-tRNA(Gln) amidotransferase subunit GatA [Fervidobacterium thailandense]ODN31477.1 aspartyl/glutamyl-tRNA amidotransferase subunit A [Fervidobacterium thailandense]
MTLKEALAYPSKEELVQLSLGVIDEEDKRLNAFITVNRAPGKGIPMGIKDNINIQGLPTTCASKILANYVATFDATVIRKLRKAGFAFMGKTNLDEFAMGASTEYSAFGPSRNPHDLERVAGGSSGGSAAAVASGEVIAALGSDTGGSIRQPAAFCGVVGFKPTYGLVSRYGLVAFASSLDQIGPITKTVEDAALVMNIIAGKDEHDATTVDREINFTEFIGKTLDGMKIAVAKQSFSEGVEDGIKERTNEFIKFIERLGNKVDVVDIPELRYVVATYYIIAPAEVSSNLARFDGVKYGLRLSGKSLRELYEKTRGNGFGEEVRRRILIGTFTLSAAYYDAYFEKAQKVRRLISKKFAELFESYDFVVTPTAPVTAFKVGSVSDPMVYYLMDIFTIPANLAGLPAISIPFGKVDHLPVGMQIMGPRFSDAKLLGFADHVFRMTHHKG